MRYFFHVQPVFWLYCTDFWLISGGGMCHVNKGDRRNGWKKCEEYSFLCLQVSLAVCRHLVCFVEINLYHIRSQYFMSLIDDVIPSSLFEVDWIDLLEVISYQISSLFPLQ